MSDDFRAEDRRNPSLAGARADARPTPIPTPTTTSSTTTAVGHAREQLVSALEFRGVIAASSFVETIADEDLEKAVRVIAYYDAQPNIVHKGLLVKLLRDGFDPPPPSSPAARSTPESRSRKQYDEFCEWARRERFSERMVPFAASAYATLKFMRSAEPTRAEVKARVLKQYPWLEKP